MPRGKRIVSSSASSAVTISQPRKTGKDDEWGGFVQVSIDEAHREEFDLWLSETGEGVYRELDDAVGSGLKFTMAYDGSNLCYIASLTGRPDTLGVRTFTCCLSGRAGTFAEAIAVLMYKHCALLHYDWWDAVNAPKKSRFTFG